MTTSELFDLWAPMEAVWSRWAKPVLFADMTAIPVMDPDAEPLPELGLQHSSGTAVIVDLPGADSVRTGLALLASGFRPIPLFNGNRGPVSAGLGAVAILNNDVLLGWLHAGAAVLRDARLPVNAPPAFLLDSRRKTDVSPTPGRFDNRWVVFPQDFPSATFLKSQGITQAVLIKQDVVSRVQEDLTHVLRRWQEGGISLYVYGLNAGTDLQPLTVEKPSHFKTLWYTALALSGLRRNSAGGFGSVIPQPSSG